MIIVGYYTHQYVQDAQEFASSCIANNVKVYCESVVDRGSWMLNTSYKPTFILNCINRFNEDIVYCDVDARVEAYPSLFDNIDCDISYFKGAVWAHDNQDEVLSGTIYFKNCEKVKIFVENWKNKCDSNTRDVDQVVLSQVVLNDCSFKPLPVEYCAIFDSPKIQGKQVVIRHLQHSRQRRHE